MVKKNAILSKAIYKFNKIIVKSPTQLLTGTLNSYENTKLRIAEIILDSKKKSFKGNTILQNLNELQYLKQVGIGMKQTPWQ